MRRVIMANFREIISRAIISKGKKIFSQKDSLKTDKKPTTILGCWVINHQFSGVKQGNDILINGSYDINIWYSEDNDTKTNVINETIKYSEEIKAKSKLDLDFDDTEVIVRVLGEPTCSNAKINGNIIDFEIEKELGIEIVGDTKIKIDTIDDDDNWTIFDDEVTEETLKEIDENVEEEFLE
jgi:spore coat protein E